MMALARNSGLTADDALVLVARFAAAFAGPPTAEQEQALDDQLEAGIKPRH
jgi:hypothetical protein